MKFVNLIVNVNNNTYRLKVESFSQAFAFVREFEKEFDSVSFRFETQIVN